MANRMVAMTFTSFDASTGEMKGSTRLVRSIMSNDGCSTMQRAVPWRVISSCWLGSSL